MGHTATRGNALGGHKYNGHIAPRMSAGTFPVKTEEFAPITDDQPTLAPDYTRGTYTGGSGLTIKGGHLTNGVEFRKVSTSREELKVDGGRLVLRLVTRKDRKAWVGEFVPTGSQHGEVLVSLLVVKGQPPVKGEARDALICRAVLANLSIY